MAKKVLKKQGVRQNSSKESLETYKTKLTKELDKVNNKLADLSRPQPTSADWFQVWYNI